jgi:hypothetical protein
MGDRKQGSRMRALSLVQSSNLLQKIIKNEKKKILEKNVKKY